MTLFGEFDLSFPVCDPGARNLSAVHDIAVSTIAWWAWIYGWEVGTLDMTHLGWGVPDLLIQGPGRRPWLLEYKSGSLTQRQARAAILQTYGYACALQAEGIELDAAYVVAADEAAAKRVTPFPGPLSEVHVTSATGMLWTIQDAAGVPHDEMVYA